MLQLVLAEPLAPAGRHRNTMTSETLLLTIRETAIELRVSRATVERMLADGRLTRIKLGGATRVARVELLTLIEMSRSGAA